MNDNLIRLVLENEHALIPLIFTKKQIMALRKKHEGKSLSNAQRKAMSTSIRKKIEALDALFGRNDVYIRGSERFIQGRLEQAEQILEEYSSFGKVFIAGSFLFSREYNDIDIFIITRRGYKEEWRGNRHIIYLTEKRLSKPIFQSTAKISLSTFPIPNRIEKKRPKLENLMSDYHEAVIEKMGTEEKQEAARRLVFAYWLFVGGTLPDASGLSKKTEQATLDDLDSMMGELCKKLFSKHYLYIAVHTYIKTLKESIKNIKPNEHLVRYRNAYEKMIYGRERGKAETA